MRAARHHEFTLDEYFAIERVSPVRHEYTDGEIYVMAGGSLRHNFLETRIAQLLGRALEGSPCFVMTSNQRIATPDGLYTYADGSVFCGGIVAGDDQTARDPVLIVEVLSDSTRAYDEGEKLDRYRAIPSLHTVLLVEPRERRITCWTRRPAGWTAEVAGPDDAVRLAPWDLELKVADVYAGSDAFPA